MAHDVFISYSHKDKAAADAICARLEREGIRCWYAPRDIEPGADWAGSIIDAIEETKILVLVFTDFSNASRQVLREVNNAVRTGAVIVPFRMTDSAPSGGMRYYLSAVHWLDAMNGTLEQNIEELCGVAKSVLGDGHTRTVKEKDTKEPGEQSGDQNEKTGAPAAAISGKKKRSWILLLCAAVLALFVMAAIILTGRTNPRENSAAPIETAVLEQGTETAPTPAVEVTATPEATPAPAAALTSETTPAPAAQAVEETEDDTEPVEDISNYLYKVYAHAVTLTKYFGEGDPYVQVPALVEGLPVTMIDEKCFEGHTELKKLILPDTVSTIGYRAFHGCSSLSEMNFPSALRKVGGWAFAYIAIPEAVLPESLTELGYGAFYSCLKLETVVVPESVTALGEDTFRECARLRSVTILAPEPSIHDKAFSPNSKVTIIGVPGSYAEKYARAFGLNFESTGA